MAKKDEIKKLNASNYTLDISKVAETGARVHTSGDALVNDISKKGGHYSDIGNAFAEVANACKTALNSKGLVSGDLEKKIKKAKKHGESRQTACENRRKDLSKYYDIMCDLFRSIEN